MLFSSLTFLYYFLPAVFIVYYILPKKGKNLWLLISSLIFYAWGEPRYVLLMAATILIGYVLGLLLEKSRKERIRKLIVAGAILSGIGMLIYFKYADFFIENFNRITGLKIELLRIALPIGISFYIFQMLSYVIDVYRNEAKAQHNMIKLATYIAMFPQLIAGPIVRYKDISEQLDNRTHSLEGISYGIRRFVLGLGKKVLIANSLGELVSRFEGASEKTVLYAWLYAIAIMLQIYFDFSGYSDMAIGLGSMLGFGFPENFRYPFTAGSITEFWRRWHMTLGGWFRDYLYIPLGGNRKGVMRHMRNILVVWLATGFWHGASWNFVFWGLYFAVFLVLEKLFFKRFLDKKPLVGHVYLLLLIMISFVIFHTENLSVAGSTISMLLGFGKVAACNAESLFQLRNFGVILLIGAVGATQIPTKITRLIRDREWGQKLLNILEPICLGIILLICTSFLVNGSFNPFLYFRF